MVSALGVAACLAGGSAGAQSTAPPASFDAASVKPAAIPLVNEGGNRARIEYTPNSLTMRNVALTDCVQWAYGVAEFQVSAPHADNRGYDILARAESPVPVGQSPATIDLDAPITAADIAALQPGRSGQPAAGVHSGRGFNTRSADAG